MATPLKAFGLIFLGSVVLVMIISNTHGSNNPNAAAADSGSANIVMVHGPSSDNSCIENDGEARIYVTITLRNTGDADGDVNPWATFDYSDGGNSTESYGTNNGGDYITVPAHSEVDASFYHTFNPQQHSMIRCAGYADLSETSGYYLPGS